MATFTLVEMPVEREELSIIKLGTYEQCLVAYNADDLFFIFNECTYSVPLLTLALQANDQITIDKIAERAAQATVVSVVPIGPVSTS